MSVDISDSSGIPIAISGVGYVYDEYNIENGTRYICWYDFKCLCWSD